MRSGAAFPVGNRGSNPLGDANNISKVHIFTTAVWGVGGSPDGFFFLRLLVPIPEAHAGTPPLSLARLQIFQGLADFFHPHTPKISLRRVRTMVPQDRLDHPDPIPHLEQDGSGQVPDRMEAKIRNACANRR